MIKCKVSKQIYKALWTLYFKILQSYSKQCHKNYRIFNKSTTKTTSEYVSCQWCKFFVRMPLQIQLIGIVMVMLNRIYRSVGSSVATRIAIRATDPKKCGWFPCRLDRFWDHVYFSCHVFLTLVELPHIQ